MKKFHHISLYIFTFFYIFLNSVQAHTQDSLVNYKKWIIGITEATPFVIQSNGGFKGISISSWNLVNERLGTEFRYQNYTSLSDLLEAVRTEKVDFSINPITVTDNRM